MEITINDRKYPVHFDCEAIENTCFAFGTDDINEIGTKIAKQGSSMTEIGNAIKLSRIAAYEGIKGGYRRINEKPPFADMTEFQENIKNVPEIFPVIGMFAEAFGALFVDTTTKKKPVAEK